ncbi:MAG: ribonuclease III [Arthrobacter sp.]|jgi:ribonuclease-3|nr:ribonuclease III [Arthrobacter sp.]
MADQQQLAERLGVTIDPETLRLALTHRSYAYENGGIPTNERLEFLGDSVLGFSVTGHLYEHYPHLPEGELAKRRAAVVSTRALARLAREIGVGEFILLGQGEIRTNGRDKSSILADTMEALFGATFLSSGLEPARELVLRLVLPLLVEVDDFGAGTDWKTSIQEAAAEHSLGAVVYEVTGEGPDHARVYHAVLHIGTATYAKGTGHSKKEAEQEAAEASWKLLKGDLEARAAAKRA